MEDVNVGASNNKQLRLGIILSYISEAIGVVSSLLYTPFMIQLLGKSEYGIYQAAISIVSYLSLLNFGFQSAYQRFFARRKIESGEQGVARLNGLYLIIFTVLSALALIFGFIIVAFCDAILGTRVTPEEIGKCRILFSILVVNLAVTLMTTLFSCFISAHEKFISLRIAMIIKNLASPFITIPLLLLGYGSVGVVSVTTLLSFALGGFYLYYALRKLRMKFRFHNLNFGMVKEISGFTFFIFINMIINQVNWELGKLVLLRESGSERVAEYSVGSQINSLYNMLSTSIASVYIPRVNHLIASRQEQRKVNDLFEQIGRVQWMLLALVLSGFIFFGKTFISIWAGDGYNSSYYIAVILMVASTVPLIQNLGIEIQRAMNKHAVRSIVYAAIAVVNVTITLILVPRYSGLGAAIGTAVALLLGNVLFMNIYYHKCLKINIVGFWKKMARLLPSLIPPAILGIVLMNYFKPKSVPDFLMQVILYTLLYCMSLYLFGLEKEEKHRIKSYVFRFVKR